MSIFLSTAYLAPIQYYAKLLSGEPVYIEQNENYLKQSYRNRCSILSANGQMNLSIPIEASGGSKISIKDVRIAEHGSWRHLHWNALISAYNSTPFFEYYRDDFQPFYERKYDFLFDFNEELREIICQLLDIDLLAVSYTTEYIKEVEDGDCDLRDLINPKKDWKMVDPSFNSITYFQVFEQRFGFIDNLSIVDLLFNMGNESLLVLNSSNKKKPPKY